MHISNAFRAPRSACCLPHPPHTTIAVQRRTVEVAIIGAGVAGLEAARILREHEVDFVLLEARERIGGRVFTLRAPALPVPIELGAEFVHGSAPELRDVARDAHLAVADIDGERWQSAAGRLRPLDDFWKVLDVVMQRLGDKGTDRSFEQFLKTLPHGSKIARSRALALQWVKGFHAADPARVSEHALAEGGSPHDDAREQRLGRAINGYDAVPQWIARDVIDRVRFGSVVTGIQWEPGGVRIEIREPNGESKSAVEARAAIVTLPLGVLRAIPGEPGSVMFDPPLDAIEEKSAALAGMEMGAVLRVILHTREAFWTSEHFARRAKSQNLDRLAFLHTSDRDFPIWWTSYPVLSPALVAWCGGPQARELGALADEQIIERAISALGRQFGFRQRDARKMVLASWLHNWERDPFSRGAYSYMAVGGNESPAKLARPIKRTIFFAGEASDSEGRTGTVHGALATGARAAKQLLRAL